MPQTPRIIVSPQHFSPQYKTEPSVVSVDPSGYATKLLNNPFLSYFETQPEGFKFPWKFVHRANAKAALHVVPIIETPDGQQFLHMIRVQHPPLNMQTSLMFPSGLWGDEGDPMESIAAVIRRELKEETGYALKDWALLHAAAVLTSPGMTTEQKVFALAKVQGEPSTRFRTESEMISISGSLDVPVDFVSTALKRRAWMDAMLRSGIVFNAEVAALLGLIDFVTAP